MALINGCSRENRGGYRCDIRGDDDMRKEGSQEMSSYPKIPISLTARPEGIIRNGKGVKGIAHTKLSSRVHTRLAHSFTGIGGSPGTARSTSRPSHQHLR